MSVDRETVAWRNSIDRLSKAHFIDGEADKGDKGYALLCGRTSPPKEEVEVGSEGSGLCGHCENSAQNGLDEGKEYWPRLEEVECPDFDLSDLCPPCRRAAHSAQNRNSIKFLCHTNDCRDRLGVDKIEFVEGGGVICYRELTGDS